MSRLLEPPQGRQVFTRDFTPVAGDIDANGHVNNVVYLGWVQDIAIAHWDSRAPADEATKWAWIVVRHEVDYRRSLLLGETAHARTWVGERRGPRFDRYVRIDGPDGEMCAQTRSEWVLIDAATKRPARVPAWMEEMFS